MLPRGVRQGWIQIAQQTGGMLGVEGLEEGESHMGIGAMMGEACYVRSN